MYELIAAHLGKSEIEIKSQHGATRLALDPDTVIELDGKPAVLRSLKAGDHILVQRQVGKITQITALRKNKPAAAAAGGESAAPTETPAE